MAPLRIGVNALYLIPGGVGGTEIYLRNLLETVATRLEGLITPILFLTPQEMEQFGDSLRPWLSQPPVV